MTASKAWLVRKVDEYDVELVICDSQTALSFEGTSKKLLIIDQQWEEISANQSKEFSPSAKAVIALTGSEDEEAPVLKSYDAGLLAFVCKQSAQLWKIEPGSRVPLLAKAGTAAYLEELFVTLGKGGTVVLANDASNSPHAPPPMPASRRTSGSRGSTPAASIPACSRSRLVPCSSKPALTLPQAARSGTR